jgi:hypothetical protein
MRQGISGHRPTTIRELITLLEDTFGPKVPGKKRAAVSAAIPDANGSDAKKCSHCGSTKHPVSKCWGKHPELKQKFLQKKKEKAEAKKKQDAASASVDTQLVAHVSEGLKRLQVAMAKLQKATEDKPLN